MRQTIAIAVLLGGQLLLAAPPAARPTAVFTLDAKYRELVETPAVPLADQLSRWASRCRIEPGGAIAVLTCPPSEDIQESLTVQDDSPKTPATLALFRDLDETIYLAGCPLIEDQASDSAAPQDSATAKADPEDIRNCRDVAAGQTFTTEVEDDVLRIVVRGRQLAFQIFEVREKEVTIGTPSVPSTSQRLRRIGPATTTELKGLEPQDEPHWEPPQLTTPSAGSPSERRLSGVPPAHTSLQTGSITVQCPTREAVVIIDGAYIGNCPITTLLVAGPHTVTVRQERRPEQTREFVVEAGKTLRLRMGDN